MRPRECSIEDCERGGPFRHGWCDMHYRRWRRQGDPLVAHTYAPQGSGFDVKFEAFVDKTDSCWLWTGTNNGPAGYGMVWLDGRMTLAHRASYETFVGPIPEGLEIDHLCFVRNCVNPDHLEAVTLQENTRRRDARRIAREAGSDV